MKAFRLFLALMIFSTMSLSPAVKKQSSIDRKQRTKIERLEASVEQHAREDEKTTTLCSPNVVKATTQIGVALISGTAMVLATVLKTLLDR
jgi:hypothetical protein